MADNRNLVGIKKRSTVLLIILMASLLGSCTLFGPRAEMPISDDGAGKADDQLEQIIEEEGPPDPETDVDDIGGDSDVTFPELDMLFDFEEFPENDFPRGKWSINQLIEKYGEPKEIVVYQSFFTNQYVPIEVEFEYVSVGLAHTSFDLLSFTRESFEEGDYALNENDKNLEIEIQTVAVYDENILLPRGFQIGKSTKRHILEAYPEGTAYIYVNEEYGLDEIIYHYTYKDENGILPDWENSGVVGGVNYNFGENGILTHIDVSYWYTD